MYNEIEIRRFSEEDISKKIEWVNNPENNKYLHYDLPLEYEKTLAWYKNNCDNENRYDGVIFYENIPVGLVGVLNLDNKNKKAELYILLGETQYKGQGIAYKASLIFLNKMFTEKELNKIYLYTEQENIPAQKLFEKIGFKKEGLLEEDLIYNGRKVNRYIYAIRREEYNANK